MNLATYQFKDSSGVPLPNVSVIVRHPGTTTPATIFSDEAGLYPVLGAALIADDTGTITFYSDQQIVDYFYYSPGLAATTIPDQRIPADYTVPEISVKAQGALGDGLTDDLIAFQSAVDLAAAVGGVVRLEPLPPGKFYRLSARLNATTAVKFKGDGILLDTSVSPTVPAGGSWVKFDHTDYGIYFRNDLTVGVYNSEGCVEGIGIIRNQPAPDVGWTPTTHSHDIRIEGRVTLNDVFHLCSTKGVLVRSAGVLTAHNHKGQFFVTGTEIERSADAERLNSLHYWPYWSAHSEVIAYSIANGSGIRVTRADGLFIHQPFTYGLGWLLNHADAAGAGSGLAECRITAAYADACGGAIKVVANNYSCRLSVDGITVNSDSLVRGAGSGIDLSGSVVSYFDIDDLTVTRAHESAVSVRGAAHIAKITANRVQDWDRLGLAAGAFSCDNGATLNILQAPSFSASPTTQYATGTSGIINQPVVARRGYSAVVTGMYTTRVTIANNAAISLAAPSGNQTANLVVTPASVPAAGIPTGMYWVRCTASPSIAVAAVSTTTNVTLTTGVLTGTSGTVGNLTISAANDGKVYVENRTGVSLTFTFTMIGA